MGRRSPQSKRALLRLATHESQQKNNNASIHPANIAGNKKPPNQRLFIACYIGGMEALTIIAFITLILLARAVVSWFIGDVSKKWFKRRKP